MPIVTVYSSSLAGDRLSGKTDLYFAAKSKASTSYIIHNETDSFQRIQGCGASFNEAGMVCLNALGERLRQCISGGFLILGYTHKIQVEVDGIKVFYERMGWPQ